MTYESPPGSGITVANLTVWLDAEPFHSLVIFPECHTAFLQLEPASKGLQLELRRGLPQQKGNWSALCQTPDTFQLWQDEQDRLILEAPVQSPPLRRVIVNKEFTKGQVLFDFEPAGGIGKLFYPLQDIEIILFANWLANTGDIILHASGIELDGEGYCFTGASGAGKSTVISQIEGTHARVLGEDQVILRRLGGQFWIFGTPWHTLPCRCSPQGAPLKKLIFLDRHLEPGVLPVKALDGVTRLLQTAFIPFYRRELMPGILAQLDRLSAEIPFLSLSYRLGSDVLSLI